MFSYRIDLFKIFGFAVRLDLSWIIIAVLLTWTLARGFFPISFPYVSESTYWWMGFWAVIGLFSSILFHELSHALVARKYGIPIKGITLFIFGGIAEMENEPPTPKSEFFMAIIGPIASMILGFVFMGLTNLGQAAAWPLTMLGVFSYLAWINWILAIFNMVPAFPLDGGRVLRSALWAWRGNIQWATQISSFIGSTFGIFLITWGVINIFLGAIFGGLWWILIGLFLNSAAQLSYQRLVVTKALEGEPIERFMNTHPVTVPPSIKVSDFVENYVYKYHHKMFPVVDADNRLIGCISTKDLTQITSDKWHNLTVQQIAKPCAGENAVDPHTDAVKALSVMSKTGNGRLAVVVDHNRLVGIVTLKDLLNFLSIKLDLQGEGSAIPNV